MHFTQTTPFKKYSEKKDELKNDQLDIPKRDSFQLRFDRDLTEDQASP